MSSRMNWQDGNGQKLAEMVADSKAETKGKTFENIARTSHITFKRVLTPAAVEKAYYAYLRSKRGRRMNPPAPRTTKVEMTQNRSMTAAEAFEFYTLLKRLGITIR